MIVHGYTVSKDKNGYYYAHRIGYPNIPVWGSFSKSRKQALKHCACAMALFYDEYMEWRKKNKIS